MAATATPAPTIRYDEVGGTAARNGSRRWWRQIALFGARNRVERKLIEERDGALEAARAKSAFLSAMSHEIRTPMNAVLGMADLLWETELSPEQREYVRIFRSTGDTLLQLLDAILDLSKLEARRLTLESVDFNLRTLVERTAETLAVRAHGKGLELVCEIAPDVAPERIGDPLRLRQVLLNLLSNALKFTERGEVVVRVRNAGGADGGPELEFAVADTGIGIPREKLGEIFRDFTQVDNSTSRTYGGTGLGLAISRQLVELMGGRIRVESEPGRGSIFRFTVALPIRTGAPRAALPRVDGAKVLVADGNAVCRESIRRMLEAHGARVGEATGASAASALLSAQDAAGSGYDVLIVDSAVRASDGAGLVEALQANRLASRLRSVMLLHADDLATSAARARELGAAGCIVKPVKLRDLLEAVAGVRAGSAGHRKPEHAAQAGRGVRPLRVLIAEDSEDNRILVRAYLRKSPHVLDEAEDGAIAIEKCRANHYDLVLMDLQMPVIDGYEATRAIRGLEAETHRPRTHVVALTAHAFREDVERSQAAGCDEHLAKPLRRATLLAILERHAQRVDGAAQSLSAAAR
jgi:two-component system, sensor histidine kinase and response regulator